MESNTETLALRTALRELVALSTIPAAWVGREPTVIADGLADVLLGSLHLDFAFVRLCDPKGGAAVEITRGNAWKAFPEWLQTHLGGFGKFSCKEIVSDLGGAEPCRGVVIPIGVNGDAGLVAAARAGADFPSEVDQLLLSVAANHATAAFQNARLRHELDVRVAELGQARNELEMKVSERTADLQRSESYLAEAQRLTHTGSWACNIAAREMRHSSEEHSRLYGFDPEKGTPSFEEFVQRIHPEDRPRVVELAEIANSAGKDFEAHFRIALPDGTTKYVYGTGHPVFSPSGEVAEFVGFVVDVTERKRAEEELRQNQAYLHESQRLGHMGSWAYNESSGALFASPELLRIFGRDPDQEKPSVEMFRGSVHPDDRAYVDETIDKAMSEKTDFGFDHRIILPDGSIRHVYSMAHRVVDGSDTLVIGTVMDVTERKLAEEALREALANLARVNRVTTMGELTASLAHEIKQPITAAVTDAKTCLRWLGRDDPDLPEACDAASRMVKDVTRAADIISRISLVFKKGPPQRELVDVNELIREMIVLLRSEANRYSISIRIEIDEDLPSVMADRIQLQQVFMNLMLNGIDAMKGTTARGELTIRSEGANGQLLISVSDTGVGLLPEQAEQIFDAFFTTKDNGTGMGLPISRSIIESHGGRLWAASASGRGATFQFTLPATLAAHA